MKKIVALLLFLTAVVVMAQSVSYYLPLWTGRSYMFVRLGPTLAVVNGQLDVVLPQEKRQKVNVVLVYDTAKAGWPISASATDVRVYVNGLRYVPGIDYQITDGTIKALSPNMQSDFLVVADYVE